MSNLQAIAVVVPRTLTALAITLAVLSTVTDLRTRRIPNRLTGPAMALGVVLHFTAGGATDALKSVAALMLCGSVFLLFHLAGGMGAGDVKLIAAQGALLGLAGVVSLLVFTALAGGLLALLVAAQQGQMRRTLENTTMLVGHHAMAGLTPHPELNVRHEHSIRLPYAVAIAAGTLLTLHFLRVPAW